MHAALLLALVLTTAGCLGWAGTQEGSAAPDTAHALVLASPFPDLVIQVDFQASNPPTQGALAEMLDVIYTQTLKKSVRLLDPSVIPVDSAHRNGTSWTIGEVEAVHNATFRLGADPWALGVGNEAFLHVLYLDSTLRYTYFGQDRVAGGVEDRNLIVVFQGPDPQGVKTPTLPDQVRVDQVLLIHELGHALGLVNNGAPMVKDHSLADDPYHSRNGDSVMFAGTDLIGLAERNADNRMRHGVALFDADDLADLAALRAEQP